MSLKIKEQKLLFVRPKKYFKMSRVTLCIIFKYTYESMRGPNRGVKK